MKTMGFFLAFFSLIVWTQGSEDDTSTSHKVDLSMVRGPLTPGMTDQLFGHVHFSPERGWAEIDDGILSVTFKGGKKVEGTGLSLHVPVKMTGTGELQFRIRYPVDFPTGIHGKQMGFSGGRGYDGGRGEEARERGDGWSARMMFTAKLDGVEIGLYVYHSAMPGKYGDPLGAEKFLVPRGVWHDIRFRVVPQTTAADADGKIEVWCDGERKISRENIRFVHVEEARKINRVRLELFPGGGGIFPAKDLKVDLSDLSWRNER